MLTMTTETATADSTSIPTPVAPAADRRLALRRRGFQTLGVVIAASALAAGAWWYLEARNLESTDDAYVAGDVVQITAEQAGTVVAVNVDDTQTVNHQQA